MVYVCTRVAARRTAKRGGMAARQVATAATGRNEIEGGCSDEMGLSVDQSRTFGTALRAVPRCVLGIANRPGVENN